MGRFSIPTPSSARVLIAAQVAWLAATGWWWYRLYWPRVPAPPFPDGSQAAVIELWVSLAASLVMGIGCLVLPLAAIASTYRRPLRARWKIIILALGGLASAQLLFLIARFLGWIYI